MSAIRKLKHGYLKFYKKFFQSKYNVYDELKDSQKPKTLVISCCDSRVDPAIIMNTDPGDIFVVRNIANLVPIYQPDSTYHGTSSSIEYAVKNLKVENIIVMGHSNCGGIDALLKSDKPEGSDFIHKWIFMAKSAKEKLPEHLPHNKKRCLCEKESIKISLNNLMTFPFVKEAVEKGELKIHGWYFKVNTGSLFILNKEKDIFIKFS